jgi:hypothetical protein
MCLPVGPACEHALLRFRLRNRLCACPCRVRLARHAAKRPARASLALQTGVYLRSRKEPRGRYAYAQDVTAIGI